MGLAIQVVPRSKLLPWTGTTADGFSCRRGGSRCLAVGFHPYDFSFSGLKTAMLRTVEAEASA